MPSTEQTADTQTQDRHRRDASPRSVYPAYVNRWALIVGISKYQHEHLNLEFADRDAEELYKLLQTPSGGGFEADKIIKLVNEEATTARVQRALRSFLQPAKREDIVLLYFACHGGPDRRNNPYLLTYDTDPNDISGTALPMREIRLSLKENLDADRVVIIADTCHSAAVAADINLRGTTNEAEVINTYLEEISKAQKGVAVLTSAQASETAQESKQWGDGHGVFTHFLLEGMRGAAAKDGIVRVQQLFEYVRTRVKEATKDQQHPVIGPDGFDPMLPMAITGGVNAQEHYQLGRHLYELGWLLDDANRFQAAARQFQAAIWLSQMAKTPLPQAELGLGQALLATDDYDGAIQVLSRLLERNPTEAPSATLFYLGMAQAKRRNFSAAVPAFEQFVIQNPQHELAAFAYAYIAALKTGDIGTKRAVLIGINRYADQEISPLHGCLNDVELMKTMLKQRGFQENNIIVLADEEATRSNILRQFEQLSQNTSVDDTVVIHFSGWGMGHKGPQLFVYDSKLDNEVAVDGITPVELHQLLNRIRAYNKTLVFDAKSIKEFAEYAKVDGTYNLLLATNPDELPFEEGFIGPDKGYARAGILSRTLGEALATFDRQEVTYRALLGSVIQRIRTKGFDQTPIFIGERDQRVFAPEEIYLQLFAFAQRQTYEAFTWEDLKKRYARVSRQITAPFPKAHYSFGRAFLEKGDYVAALTALETAQQQSTSHNPDIILALGKAHLGVRQYAGALRCFQQYAIMAPAEVYGSAHTLIELTQRLTQGQPHALLIGINNYSNPDIRPVRGAVNDVLAFKEVLLMHCGFHPEHIKVLLDHQATRAAILSEFKQLIEIARYEPALFYFAGNGSSAQKDELTIVSADGRQDGVYDILLTELVALSANTPNLITIVDAGWTSSKNVTASRMIGYDERERPLNRHITLERELTNLNLQIGGLSIYSYSIRTSGTSLSYLMEKELAVPRSATMQEVYGKFTHSLIQRLWQANIAELTYAQWTEATGAFVQGDHQDEPIFHNHPLETAVLQLTQEIENMPVKATIDLLRRLIEQRQQQNDPYPEGRLNLGIAYATISDYDKSIEHLERAVALYSDPSIMARELEKDPTANLHYYEARYQLGRVLFISERDFTKAVSELTAATRLNPENVPAFYYLGQAIREMVERETLAKAEEALQTYLVKESPLGHEAEVREFLGSRKQSESTR